MEFEMSILEAPDMRVAKIQLISLWVAEIMRNGISQIILLQSLHRFHIRF